MKLKHTILAIAFLSLILTPALTQNSEKGQLPEDK